MRFREVMKMAKCVTRSLEIVVILSSFLCVDSTRHGMIRCSPGTYWDHGTNKCDQCTSICLYAEQQGTVDACKKKCPGYGELTEETPVCENDTYYDKHVNKCEPCGPLCYEPQTQGTVHECETKCPGYLKNNEVQEPSQQDVKDSNAGLSNDKIMMIATICILTAFVVIAVIGIVLVWRRCHAKNNRDTHAVNDKKYPVQAENRTPYPGPERQSLFSEENV